MFFKRLFSYVYPVILQQYDSAVSGKLELSLQNGQLVLDTLNANYSFGNLHLVFRKAIGEFTFQEDKKKVLILGFGAGSIASILNREYHLDLLIDGVELDEKVIAIYKKYFSWQDDRITLYHKDAILFLEESERTYDYIFIDIFQNLDVPEVFTTPYFFELIKKVSKSHTQIAMNIIARDTEELKNVWDETFGDKNFSKEYFDLNTVLYHIPKK